MDLGKLNFIIERIKKDISCPNCKAFFQEKDVDITSIRNNEIELCSTCHTCHIKAKILATVEVHSKQIPPHTISRKNKSLSPASIRGLSQKLKKLNGNVKDLFKEE